MKTTSLLAALVLAGSAMVSAQDAPPARGERPPPREGRPDGPPRGPEGGPGRPVPPLMAALDANKDGVIDAAEIANASAALGKLDKNGDGRLTTEELRPPRPPQGEPGSYEPRDRRPGGPPPGDGQRPPGGPRPPSE